MAKTLEGQGNYVDFAEDVGVPGKDDATKRIETYEVAVTFPF